MIRDTAMRRAFIDAVNRQLQTPVIKQVRLVERTARIIDAGSGLRRPRAK